MLIQHDKLIEISTSILEAAGAPADKARLVSEHLVEANLKGHDSHGVGMVSSYVRSMLAGLVDVNKDAELINDAGAGCDTEKAPRSLECKLALFRTGGDERCLSCHGNLRQMDVVKQVDDNFGKMGWCMECHLQVKGAKERKRTGSTLDGWYHAKEMDAKREEAIGLINEKGYHNPNMLDCYTCHY